MKEMPGADKEFLVVSALIRLVFILVNYVRETTLEYSIKLCAKYYFRRQIPMKASRGSSWGGKWGWTWLMMQMWRQRRKIWK